MRKNEFFIEGWDLCAVEPKYAIRIERKPRYRHYDASHPRKSEIGYMHMVGNDEHLMEFTFTKKFATLIKKEEQTYYLDKFMKWCQGRGFEVINMKCVDERALFGRY